MSAPGYMAYTIIGGVLLVSLLAPIIIGFKDAWFVPLVVLVPAALYAAYDAKLRRDERRHGPANEGH